jgi:hypothetical protein
MGDQPTVTSMLAQDMTAQCRKRGQMHKNLEVPATLACGFG